MRVLGLGFDERAPAFAIASTLGRFQFVKGVRATPKDLQTLAPYARHVLATGARRRSEAHFDNLTNLGTLLAHRKAWRNVARFGRALILEENAIVDADRTRAVLGTTKGMDFVQLHTWERRRRADRKLRGTLYTHGHPRSSLKAYVLSRRLARQALREKRLQNLHADHFLCLEAMYAGNFRHAFYAGKPLVRPTASHRYARHSRPVQRVQPPVVIV